MIYVSCFAVSVFFAYLAQHSRNKGVILFCSVISILVPSILGGLRAYGLGTDTVVYAYPHFRSAMRASSFLSFLGNQFDSKLAFNEIGYKALCYITSNTLQHENWCYFVYQLVTVGCVYIGAYRHKDKIPLALTMFVFFMMYYNYSYNAIRQSMAAAIIFMGIYDMEKGRYGVFLAYVIVASLFHTSAFLGIPLILAFHVFNSSDFFSRKIFLRMLVVGGALAFLIMARPVMRNITNTFAALSKYDYYFDSTYDDSGIVWGLVIILAGELIMSILYPEGANARIGWSNVKFYRFQAAFMIVYLVAVRFFTRVLDYSAFANMIFLAALPGFVREKHMRFIVMCAVIGVTVFWWSWKTIHMGHGETYPYRSIL